ncbi:hypothetical protein CTH_1690 [Carboxydocella thermautotrophica]|nr:hypothetical protein CTH_1690 [Carboxydocella thermautotrophica]
MTVEKLAGKIQKELGELVDLDLQDPDLERILTRLMRHAKQVGDSQLQQKVLTYYNDYLFLIGEV